MAGKLHLKNAETNFYGEVSGLTYCGREYSGSTATGAAIALQIANPNRPKDDSLVEWKREKGELCMSCSRKVWG